jgi:hypothetical protein
MGIGLVGVNGLAAQPPVAPRASGPESENVANLTHSMESHIVATLEKYKLKWADAGMCQSAMKVRSKT